MAASSATNENIYTETAWWWDAEDDDSIPHYTKMYQELKKEYISKTERTYAEADVEADIGTDTSCNSTVIHFGSGADFDYTQYVVTDQYMYSPRTEPFKYSICVRSVADKIVSYYHVYASDPITAITCCFKNHWFPDDLITDLVARDIRIYDELCKSYNPDIKVKWKYNGRSSIPCLYGYTVPGASPIIVTMEEALNCIGRTSHGGIECAIYWSISEIPIHVKSMTVMGFLRTNMPRVPQREPKNNQHTHL